MKTRNTTQSAAGKQQGSVLVMTALMIVVLLGCVGLAFDVGKMADRYRQAQNAADAAALGAAYKIHAMCTSVPAGCPGATLGKATDKAQQLVQLHNLPTTDLGPNDAENAPIYLDATGAQTITASAVVTVTATIHDTFPTIFMHVLGIHTRWVNATAVASVYGASSGGSGSGGSSSGSGTSSTTSSSTSGSGSGSGSSGTTSSGTSGSGSGNCGVLCVLNPTKTDALDLASSATVKVTGGNITVKSNANPATEIHSDGNIYAPQIDVGGVAQYDSGGRFYQCTTSTSCSQGTTSLTSTVTDPLWAVPVPSCPTDTPCTATPPPSPVSPPACALSGTPASLSTDVNCTIGPGVYHTLTLNSCSSVTLQPGTYIITGQFTSASDCNITGTGVMLYFTCPSSSAPYYQPCATGQAGGALTLGSGGGLTLSAPTSGTYQGMAIFYDRNDKSGLNLESAGSVKVTGTIYAKSSAVTLASDGGIAERLDSLLVADTVELASGGGININYTASNNYGYSGGTSSGTSSGTSTSTSSGTTSGTSSGTSTSTSTSTSAMTSTLPVLVQ